MSDLIQSIRYWKEKQNAAILAHYYTAPEVQEIADYIGDSFYLSKIATELSENTLLFCGVTFMGESAKIMNPQKTVLMPDMEADCPMAHMITADEIKKVRQIYDDIAVVCYINSDTEIKACSDVCVTSANALAITKALPQKNIFFVPDENLGRFIAEQLPEKKFYFCSGYCPVHVCITPDKVNAAKKSHPGALVLMHPECTPDTIKTADYVGSTAGIIKYAVQSSCKEFIIATENGVLTELKKQCPEKIFFPVAEDIVCPSMKRITLEKILDSLQNLNGQVILSDETIVSSRNSLTRMMDMSGVLKK